MIRKNLFTALAALCLMAPAMAQDYPSRPVTLVLGFASGGPADNAARIVAEGLSKRLGQPVVVENKPGAVGTIAAGIVARAAPDGYTLFVANPSTLGIAPHTFPSVPFDPIASFAAITQTVRSPWVLMVSPSLPVNNVAELVAYAKANPGKLNYGSVGRGGSHNFVSEYFKLETGTDIRHVPYKGSADAHVGLMRGDIHVMFDTMPSPIGLIESGRVKGLALTGTSRLSALPDVPTFGEVGLPQIDTMSWFGLAAPAKTPPAIVARLQKDTEAALSEPAVKETLRKSGLHSGAAMKPEEFAALIAADHRRWQKIIEASGFKKE